MNKLDLDYQELLKDIMKNGTEKVTRSGGTKSVFGRQIRHKMSEGFPLLTTKKMPWKVIVTELMWFLKGDTNIKYLVDNGSNIWNGDAYKKYATEMERGKHGVWLDEKEFINEIKNDDEFAKKWGELGPIYGKQWRSWSGQIKSIGGKGNKSYDQIANVIETLKTNPDSRRMMVNAWNVGEIDSMTLPPCHYGFQVYTREFTTQERCDLMNKKHGTTSSRDNCFSNEEFEREVNQDANAFDIPTRAVSLMWNQRSVDTFLGLPFNIASYGLLLEIIAKEVNMIPDELIGNLGDTHLYLNHIDQATEQMGSELSDKQLNKIFKELDAESFETFVTAKRLKTQAVKDMDYKEAGKQRDIERVAKAKLAKLELPIHDRQPFDLPNLIINDEFWNPDRTPETFDWTIKGMEISDFHITNYKSHPSIKAPLSN
jgi:thymidylate synthase